MAIDGYVATVRSDLRIDDLDAVLPSATNTSRSPSAHHMHETRPTGSNRSAFCYCNASPVSGTERTSPLAVDGDVATVRSDLRIADDDADLPEVSHSLYSYSARTVCCDCSAGIKKDARGRVACIAISSCISDDVHRTITARRDCSSIVNPNTIAATRSAGPGNGHASTT